MDFKSASPNLTIKNISNKTETSSIFQTDLKVPPQNGTLAGLPIKSYISEPFIFKTNFADPNMPVSLNLEVMGRQQVLQIDRILPKQNSIKNPFKNSHLNELPKNIDYNEASYVIEREQLVVVSKPLTLNCNLNVERGSRIFFAKGAYLIVKGSLNVQGSSDLPVVMTSETKKTVGVEFSFLEMAEVLTSHI